ncbi:MAG: hypothetical protein CM1200mP3_14780 [Chloroflexota bacterium]|nr:MAG: hypothetical protein CM1200mP3_14780 [Chloroflexota bacterium]
MLHADHTFEAHPWAKTLAGTSMRGLGVELRLLGIDPDQVEKIARKGMTLLSSPRVTSLMDGEKPLYKIRTVMSGQWEKK